MEHRFEKLIKSLLADGDMYKILKSPLTDKMSKEVQFKCRNSVENFLEEFNKMESDTKIKDFIVVSKDISEWIPLLLGDTEEAQYYQRRFDVIFELLHLQMDDVVDSFPMDEVFLRQCCSSGLLTVRLRDELITKLAAKGVTEAKYQFLWEALLRKPDAYSLLLVQLYKSKADYIEKFCDDLHKMINQEGVSESEIIECIMAYGESVVSSNMDIGLIVPEVNADPIKVQYDGPRASNDTVNSGDSMGNGEDFDALLQVSVDKTSTEMLNFQLEFTQSSPDKLCLREYQHELAQRGVEGKNILICAPTSSGKTVVAIKIADEHMKSRKDGKVILVVPSTVLVDQQFDIFYKYLQTLWKIHKISGRSKSFSVPLSMQLAYFDIFIVTCDILRKSLEEPLESIGALSLIIFDECHHTDKDHSYNKVMDHYFKNKQLGLPVPQVIGMTASTGTDKATNVDSALKFLLSLCANLDCRIVSTVKINTEELNKNLPTPTNEIKTPGMRENDVFEICLLTLMESIEAILEGIFSSKAISIVAPTDRYEDKYLNFVKSITNFHPNLLSEEERKGVIIIEIYLEYLYRALIVNHLFNYTHAIKSLKERIERKADCTCAIDGQLRNLIEGFLDSSFADQDKNPSLECLKEEIYKQIEADKSSKIIIFVKEVLYTRILESEIQNANMGFIKCKALVGTNKSADQGGLSKSETHEIVSRFRRGIINVLFATSLPEEGFDIDKCNLVMRYGYVTNEISMVQSRGRARASDSKYVVIVPHKLKWQENKENINNIRETMMYQAITQFQNMSLGDIEVELLKVQEMRLALRVAGPCRADTAVVPVSSASPWCLHCIKCELLLCSSQDIRVAHGTSYIIVNKDTYPNLPMKGNSQINSTVVCVNCKQQIGQVIKVHNICVPNINIKQCLLRLGTERIKRKQWKEAPFSVPVVTGSDLSACKTDLYTLM